MLFCIADYLKRGDEETVLDPVFATLHGESRSSFVGKE
jgi:hypothetical protein